MAIIDAYMLAGTVETEHASIIDTVVCLQNKKTTLAQVVESIGDYIVDEDKTCQAKAIGYLSGVLSEIGSAVLSRQDIDLVVTYLSSRIATPYAPGVRESACGLRALVGMDRFMKDSAPAILKSTFTMARYFNEYLPATRKEVYLLLELLITKEGCAGMDNLELIKGFLGLMELEKDPRCLVLVFPMIRTLCHECDVTLVAKELWEAVTSYFPVTFRQPENDTIGITPEDLKLHLRNCMAGTSSFGPLAFPYLIGKLDELAKANTKRDVLQTMSACVQAYSFDVVSAWSDQIWDALKFEVFNATDESLVEEVLNTIGSIVKSLSYDGLTWKTVKGTPLYRFVTLIINECIPHFRRPQHEQVRQTSRIIGRVAIASPVAFSILSFSALQPLLDIHRDIDVRDEKIELLEVFNELLDGAVHHTIPADETDVSSQSETEDDPMMPGLHGLYSLQPLYFLALGLTSRGEREGSMADDDSATDNGSSSDVESEILQPPDEDAYVVEGVQTYGQDMPTDERDGDDGPNREPMGQDLPIYQTAVRGLTKLTQIPDFLLELEISRIVKIVAELTFRCGDESNLKVAVVSALRTMGPWYHEAVTLVGFRVFMSRLPTLNAPEEKVAKAAWILQTLASVALDQPLYSHFCEDMVHKLSDVRNSRTRWGTMTAYSQIILQALLYAAKNRDPDQHDRVMPDAADTNKRRIAIFCNLFCSIVDIPFMPPDRRGCGRKAVVLRTCRIAVEDNELQNEFEHPDVLSLSLLGRYALALLRVMTIEQQQKYASTEVFTLFVEGRQPGAWADREILTLEDRVYITETMLELMFAPTPEYRFTLPLSVYVLASLRREVRLNFYPDRVCYGILRSYLSGTEFPVDTHEALLGLMSLMFNKWCRNMTPPLPEYTVLLKLAKDIVMALGSFEGERLTRAIDAVMIFTKAANMKADIHTGEFLCLLVDQLGRENIGGVVAAAFTVLLSPSEILCSANHVYMGRYHKQRPLSICLGPITELFNTTDDSAVKDNCIVALTGILKWTPPAIFLNEIEKLMPLILYGLEMPGMGANIISIEVVTAAFVKSPASMQTHIWGIIKRLTEVHAKDLGYWPSPVRSKIYECLGVIPDHFMGSDLITYKFDVLRRLERGVNDEPRELREEAARCRSAWFDLEEATEEDA